MSISIVSSAKSVARRLKYQPTLISNPETRAAAQELVIRSLVTELNSQVRHTQGAVNTAYLLCHSLSSDPGPAPLELCCPCNVNRAVEDPDPAPHHVQRDAETCTPDPVQETAHRAVQRPCDAEDTVEAPWTVGQFVGRRVSVPVDQIVERVVQVPFAKGPRQVQVPVPVNVPVPREVIRAQDIATDAPVLIEHIVKKLVQVPVPVHVHGSLAFCTPTHPLVAAWLSTWRVTSQSLVKDWRCQARERDRFLLGKLLIPQSLHEHLVKHVKSKEAKRNIRMFQSNIVPILDEILHPTPSPGMKRKNLFIVDH